MIRTACFLVLFVLGSGSAQAEPISRPVAVFEQFIDAHRVGVTGRTGFAKGTSGNRPVTLKITSNGGPEYRYRLTLSGEQQLMDGKFKPATLVVDLKQRHHLSAEPNKIILGATKWLEESDCWIVTLNDQGRLTHIWANHTGKHVLPLGGRQVILSGTFP